MTFSLNGGIGLLVVVGLWLVVMVPNWGRSENSQNRVSTNSRKFSSTSAKNTKKSKIGVSKSEKFRNKNRGVRRLFFALILVSIALVIHGLIQFQANVVWLLEAVAGGFLFSFSASVLRNTAAKNVAPARPSQAQREQDRLRMAYFIREAAMQDASPDELFDERVWTGSGVPESALNRRVGAIDMSALAEIVSLDEVRGSSDDKKFNSEQLDDILKRRRTGN